MERFSNKQKGLLIGGIFLILLLIVGGTYAWYVVLTNNTNISFSVDNVTILYDAGPDISAEGLMPTLTKDEGVKKDIKIKLKDNITTPGSANLYLDINALDDSLKEESFKWEVYKNGSFLTSGNFSNVNVGDTVTLFSNQTVTNTGDTYSLYLWIDGGNFDNPSDMLKSSFSFTLHASGTGANIVEEPVVNIASQISDKYVKASKTEVVNNNITYNYATSESLMADTAGNIRYYGPTPNNYIYFNCQDYNNQSASTCELWRIIGVFGDKVKIMRNNSIGDYSWDNKNTSTGAEDAYGKNDWTTARLMKLLNPSDYYTIDPNDNGNGQSLYYNSQSGNCFSGQNNTTKSCDFTSTGIKNDVTRNKIAEVTWNLGGHNSNSVFSDQIYTYERGTNVFAGRPTTWKGKIALMYPSDYGYATDFNQCTTQTLYDYDNTNCRDNDWIFKMMNGSSAWTLTPDAGYAGSAWFVTSSGFVSDSLVYRDNGVRPVLYLNSEQVIKAGEGTGESTAPYQLQA